MSAISSLWDEYLTRAHTERERIAAGEFIVSREELPIEVTPFGVLRWYLHPKLVQRASSAFYFFEIEIPSGSRSGRLRHQGGIVHLVAQGSGYTELDGVEHRWEKRDIIGIPTRPLGVEFQHFNDGRGPARLVVMTPNYDSSLGPQLGVELEVVDACPEFLNR